MAHPLPHAEAFAAAWVTAGSKRRDTYRYSSENYMVHSRLQYRAGRRGIPLASSLGLGNAISEGPIECGRAILRAGRLVRPRRIIDRRACPPHREGKGRPGGTRPQQARQVPILAQRYHALLAEPSPEHRLP
jgi:hypothetical protein